MATNDRGNPFPLEAVASFGSVLRTSEGLAYMGRAKKELDQYLLAHPKTETRYGGAIGLSGGHGSGKTHLLGWIAQAVRERQRADCSVVYGKVDSASLFDLYKQLISQIDRARLITLLSQATRNIAIEQVRSAKVTESLETRIGATQDLSRLYSEGNLDQDEIVNLLIARLRHAGLQQENFPEDLSRVLLSVGHSVSGDVAYQWLLGNDVDTSILGVTYQLRQLNREQAGSADADRTAVDALELIAALHALAGAPFVLLIDQLEVLFRTDDARQQIAFSLIKKFIEQIGGQHALVFIAGADEAWQKLPRDVPPRMRNREPLRVGNLTKAETIQLLLAYDPSATLPDAVAGTIHELSGGSPREILRIAYHAFEKTGGHLDKADEQLLLAGAQDSGTIADRHAMALAIADQVLSVYGQVAQNLAIGGDVVIDRVVKQDGVPFLALQVVKVPDKLSEASTARAVNVAAQYLEQEWPGTALVVVAVGYSSAAVQSLLRLATTVMSFNEAVFRNELETAASRVTAKRQSRAPQAGHDPDPSLLALLNSISTKLEALESQRGHESDSVRERFASSTAAVVAEETKRRELRSRWEILEELDRLDEALKKGQALREREIIRGILIANETFVKQRVIDQLGGLYLNVVSAMVYRTEPPPQPTLAIRSYMIDRMRRALVRPTLLEQARENVNRVTYVIAVAAAIIVMMAACAIWALDSFAFRQMPLANQIMEALPYGLGFGAAAGATTWTTLRWSNSYQELEKHVQEILDSSRVGSR